MNSLRVCVGCGGFFPKDGMLRVVRTKNGAITDGLFKIEGRGAYVCKSLECVERARKRGGLSKSFKRAVDKGIYEELRGMVGSGDG